MDDFSEIKKAVVDLNLTAKDSAFNHGETDAIGSTETALTLQRVVNTLMADNLELHNRLSAIEAKITTMYAEFSRAEFLHESNDTTRDRCIRPAMHLDPKTTPKRDPDVSHGHTERFSSLGLRTRDLKDQMIADQQERRERTHEAVDDVEAYAKGQPCPSCTKLITKWCFIEGCFDWCFLHSAVCTGDMCTSNEAGAYCDIITCDYSREEWQEEELLELIAGQSP